MADILGVNKKMAQVVVRQLIDAARIRKVGETRVSETEDQCGDECGQPTEVLRLRHRSVPLDQCVNMRGA